MQGQQVYLKHYTVDDGLPSNETYQVLEDPKGNLLVATDRGAVRFDGYSFEMIPGKNRLTSKPVYYIYQSPANKIYYSSLQGAIYEYKQDTLYDYAFNRKAAGLFNHPGILIANTIAEHKDTLWISYNNDFNYNYKVGSCFVTPAGAVQRLNNPDGIYFDLGRRFYYRQLSASTYNARQQPLYIRWPNGSLTNDSINLSWRGGYIRRLYYEQMGDYDLFCIGRKLVVYKNGVKISSHLLDENVLCLTKTATNEFFIGFENIGALRFQLNEGMISALKEQVLDKYSVTCIYKDRQDGIWFSTMENGLFYQYPSHARFWESDSKIVSIVTRNNKAHVGYQSGLIETFSGTKKVQSTRLPLPSSSSLSRLSFTHEDSLIAFTEKGYYVREEKSWRFYASQDAQLLSVSKYRLFGATAASPALHLYEGIGKPVKEKFELTKRIISLHADEQQQLWIGTWEGLLLYKNSQLIDYSKENPVFKDRIVAVGELPDKSLVVASLGNGLVITKGNRYFELNTTNGLRTSVINTMVIHGQDIWLGHNKGLTKVNFANGHFQVAHYGVESGMPTADIHQFAVSNGHVYIKWIDRLVVVSTRILTKPTIMTGTYLTSVSVNDQKQADINNSSFDHYQNGLTFAFSCPNLSSAHQQVYLYRLEGFEKAWHRTNERYAKYTNLPPGQYLFKVQAISLRDGTPSTPVTYLFTIKAAFWQTRWFQLAIGATVILLMSVIFQLRLNSIKKKNQLLLELAENRAKVLVQLIHPHFVFNVLNTIQGAILKQDKMQAASLVSKLAKLMRLSLKLGKEKRVLLADEIALLKKYFELEDIRSPGRFTYEIEAVAPLNPELVLVPSMLVQPFVENAIKHGVMHLEEKQGSIHIRFRQEGNLLLCTVADNGVGMKQSQEINKTNRKNHSSSGIEITLSRLKLAHKEEGTAFFYRVEDKQDASGKAEGTAIHFSIPYLLSHEANSNNYR